MGDINIGLEIFGYVGTVLIIISMLMTSITKLRIFNMCGSVISTTYSIIVGTWPIVVMNICLFIINLFQVVIKKRKMRDLAYIRVDASDTNLQHFIKINENGLKEKYPEYDFKIDTGDDAWLIYQDNLMVAFFVGKTIADCFYTKIFYIESEYEKDTILLFKKRLKECKIRKMHINIGTKGDYFYLSKVGFSESENGLVCEL